MPCQEIWSYFLLTTLAPAYIFKDGRQKEKNTACIKMQEVDLLRKTQAWTCGLFIYKDMLQKQITVKCSVASSVPTMLEEQIFVTQYKCSL